MIKVLLAAFGCYVILFSLVVGCSRSSSAPPPPGATATELPIGSGTKTWGGDLSSVVSLKEMMRDLVDPLSDNIFDAVGSEVTQAGVNEWAPHTDAEWAKARVGAVAMTEVSHLLKLQRVIEPDGWEKLPRDRDTGELLPPEILEKILKDPVLWMAKVEVLRNVGEEAMQVIDKKDAKALFAAAGDLDAACEGCHLEFYYPSQNELLKKLYKGVDVQR